MKAEEIMMKCNQVGMTRRQAEMVISWIREAEGAALEGAAKVADQWATPEQREFGNGGPGEAVRALKGK